MEVFVHTVQVSQSNIELQEKMNKINELEDMVNAQRKELKHAHDQLQEVVNNFFFCLFSGMVFLA